MKTLLIGYLIFIIAVAFVIVYLISRLKIKFPGRILFIILLVIASPVIISYFLLSYLYPLPETTVPDLNGMSQAQAQQKLEDTGLCMYVEKKYEGEDIITFQRPEPGRTVKEGRSVTVIVGKPKAIGYFTTPEADPAPPPPQPVISGESENEGDGQL